MVAGTCRPHVLPFLRALLKLEREAVVLKPDGFIWVEESKEVLKTYKMS